MMLHVRKFVLNRLSSCRTKSKFLPIFDPINPVTENSLRLVNGSITTWDVLSNQHQQLFGNRQNLAGTYRFFRHNNLSHFSLYDC